MGLICSYCHTCFHMWKLKDRANTKVTRDHMTGKSQGWAWNLGRVYPFHQGTLLLLHGRNSWAPLGTGFMLLLLLFRGNCFFLTWCPIMNKVRMCDYAPDFYFKMCTEPTDLFLFSPLRSQ